MSKETEYSDFILKAAEDYDLEPFEVREIYIQIEDSCENWLPVFYEELEFHSSCKAEDEPKPVLPIPALPLSDQIKRLSDNVIFGVDESASLEQILNWNKFLSKPFNPEQIPDILEGWESYGGALLKIEEDSNYNPLINVAAREIIIIVQSWEHPFIKPETLNDFLADLKRSGITAHFRADWIKKMGLA